MRIIWKLSLLGLLLSTGAHGQPEYWNPIATDGEIVGSGILYYSQNLELCVSTNSLRLASGTKYIAGYNGMEWINLADSVGDGFNAMVDFEEGILIGGSTTYIGSQHMPHVAYYDGIEWSYPFNFNASVSKLKWVNDTLFALGHFTEIDGLPAYKIARLVNGLWQGVLEPYDDLSWSNFLDITYFEGEYYVGGNFESVEGPDDFAILRDGTLHQVGQGLTGSWTAVSSLDIYMGELYMAGSIPMVQGNIGDHILKWDGENYHPLAGPFLNEQGNQSVAGADIMLMKVHGDFLYICGDFHFIDDGYFNRLARWDGTQWCGLYTDHLTEGIFGFDFVNDQIFVMSPTVYSLDPLDYDNFILYLGGDEVSSCSTPLSTDVQSAQPDISLYPNPVFQSGGSGVSITSSVHFSEISIFDLSGRGLLHKRIPPSQRYDLQLDHNSFPSGVYLIQVGGDGWRESQKLIVLN